MDYKLMTNEEIQKLLIEGNKKLKLFMKGELPEFNYSEHGKICSEANRRNIFW